MSTSLPQAVAIYFDVSNGADVKLLTQCFTPTAVVTDEAKTYQGLEAVVAWKIGSKKTFEYTVEPLRVSVDGVRVSVTAKVVGNFPGSPVDLDHEFRLLGEKIDSLEIR